MKSNKQDVHADETLKKIDLTLPMVAFISFLFNY